jgi:hypothetical protein
MTVAHAKAPTLAWLLTALTCLLAGMAIVESRHQTVVLPHPDGTRAPVGTVETVAVAGQPTAVPGPTLDAGEPVDPAPPLLFEVAPVRLSAGSAHLRVTRLTVPPGVGLSSEAVRGPTVLLIEAGTVAVRIDRSDIGGTGLEAVNTAAVLGPGEPLIVAPGERYAVRNDGPAPAVALLVAIVPVE